MKKILITLLILNTAIWADDRQQEALETIKKLGGSLKKELQAAMKSGGPIKALEVCNVKAMPLTREAMTKGISVGRASTKNRNPKNKPEEWMESYIEDFHAGKIKKPYVVVKLSSNTHGILKPIKTMPVCLNCHGKNVKSDVRQKINELYPKDKAIGYKVGEIRGFFWATY